VPSSDPRSGKDRRSGERRAAPLPTKLRPPTSKAEGPNPKDLQGKKKISLTKVSSIALLHCAHAMMDGAKKYDPYNWRAKDITASIYVDAGKRHFDAWFEGEELADDSKAHHLGHAMACAAILLDAIETGGLIDDRPVTERSRGVYGRVMKRLALIEQEKAILEQEKALIEEERRAAARLRRRKARARRSKARTVRA